MNENEEKQFRRNRQWTSFKAQVFTALSMATFIGLLGKIVPQFVDLLGSPDNLSTALTAAAANPLPAIAIAATLAVGVAITYVAQHEWTDLKVMEDEHLAKRNAECNALEKAKAKSAEKMVSVEYEHNCRSDGQSWQQAVANKPELIVNR